MGGTVGDRLLILGASARAAAASARRAGLEPFAIDLFADRDTRLLCDCLRCPPAEYPEGLFRLARQAPPMPWMYTGGLENYPELVDAMAKERPLLGNHSQLIARIRDPYTLHAILTAHDIPTPAVLPFGSPPPGGRWVTKRLGGSAGHAIGWYRDGSKGDYLQRFVPGLPMSAVYLSMPWRVYLLGTTRQLVGEPWTHARTFAYCGSVGPITLTEDPQRMLRKVGLAVTQYGPKFGFFGVDFILDDDGRPNPIEVNPRYPASVEVLDHAYRQPLFKWHVDCADCLRTEDWDVEWQGPTGFTHRTVVGKAIYFAPHTFTFPASGPWDDSLAHATDVWRRPDFADIPHPGDVIEAGHPVLTFFAETDSEEECLRRLQSRAAELDRLFGVAAPMT